MHYPEAVSQTRFLKQVFLEILQNSQENNCARVSFLEILQNLQESNCARVSFLIKLQVLGLQLY